MHCRLAIEVLTCKVPWWPIFKFAGGFVSTLPGGGGVLADGPLVAGAGFTDSSPVLFEAFESVGDGLWNVSPEIPETKISSLQRGESTDNLGDWKAIEMN